MRNDDGTRDQRSRKARPRGRAAPALPGLAARLSRRAEIEAAVLLLPIVGLALLGAVRAAGPEQQHVDWTALVAGAALSIGLALVFGIARRRLRCELLSSATELERRSRARASDLAHANAQLARIGRQRSEFFASMSHELRTPLNGILGYSRVLLDGLDGELTAEQRDDVAQVQASGQGLLAIVNDVLDLSKIEAGRVTLCRESFSLRALVEDVLDRLRPLAHEKGLSLVNEVSAELPPVRADETRTGQVLVNLVGNAIKFTDLGGVTVGATSLDGAFRVEVADTGVGIPAEAHNLIFEPFRQADQRDTRRHGGTGLGLAICRQLVAAMGGRIWLDSAVGRGTTVSLTLPAGMIASPTPVVAGASHPVAIVVGHDGDGGRALSVACEREHLAPVLTHDAASLADALRVYGPAVAVLDVLAPGAAGWQAFHALRADPASRDLSVVLTATEGHLAFGLAVGPTDYLLRPTHDAELLARLGDLLAAGRTAACPSGSLTILLVGDCASNAALAAPLEGAGYDVHRAESAREAAAQLDRRTVSAAVVDLLAPGGALATLAALRACTTRANLPIILMSPSMLSPIQQRSLYQDVLAHLRERGGEGEQLSNALRRALAGWSGAAVGSGRLD